MTDKRQQLRFHVLPAMDSRGDYGNTEYVVERVVVQTSNTHIGQGAHGSMF